MKLSIVVFFGLLLSACQSVSQTSDTRSEEPQVEGAISNHSSAIEEANQSGEFLTNVTLKKAVDVTQIDSLMQVESPTDVIESEPKEVIEPKVALEDKQISSDPITLMLLERGEVALANQKLLTPEDDNANLYFQAALGREPENTAAQKGIEEIIRFYTGWALDKAKQGHNNSANKYLSSASFVDKSNPLIQQTKNAIHNWRLGIREQANTRVSSKQTSEVVQNKFYLPKNLFSLPDELVIQKLQPIIDRIEKDQLNIEIFWPNDKEARLLYRIINSRTEDFRVRGMIYRRAQHMIEVKQG